MRSIQGLVRGDRFLDVHPCRIGITHVECDRGWAHRSRGPRVTVRLRTAIRRGNIVNRDRGWASPGQFPTPIAEKRI